MKCNSCGSEWTVGKGTSQTIKCPFCGAALKNTSSADISYNDAFKKIVDLKGESVLNDRALFLSMLSDIAPQLKDEKDITEAALGKGVGKILLEKDTAVPVRIKLAREKLSILSDSAVNIFFDAVIYTFGWKDQVAASEHKEQPKTEDIQRSTNNTGNTASSQSVSGSQPRPGTSYNAGNTSYNTYSQPQSTKDRPYQTAAKPKPAVNTYVPNPYSKPSEGTAPPKSQLTYYQSLMESYNNGRAGEKTAITLVVFFRTALALFFAIISLFFFTGSFIVGVLMMLSALMCSPFFFGKLKAKITGTAQMLISILLFIVSIISYEIVLSIL